MSQAMNNQGSYKPRILKEGFLEKKSNVLKQWRKRYFKLNGEVLCFFKKEDHNTTQPMGRIFVADILAVGKYVSKAKSKDHCFSIDTKSGKKHIMNSETAEERDAWILIVNFAKDDFLKAEEEDPVRRRSVRLNGDLKRIKLFKDPTKGIGVRIKSVNGCVFVTRIVEDGPVAETGVLRPGDQILDVDGVNVNNMTIEQVSEVLKTAPILMTCTVKPANHFKYAAEEPKTQQIEQIKKSSYAEIDIDALAKEAAKSNNEIVKAGYEDDQSSHGSQSFVIVPSDDELDHDEKTGDKFQTNGADEDNVFQSRYVNIPPEQGGKSGSPKKNTVPAGQRNYLELYFDEK